MNKILIMIVFCAMNTIFSPISLKANEIPQDENKFIFKSPRPLIESEDFAQNKRNSGGLEILLSGSGIGVGGQFERIVSNNYKINYGLFVSGKRNTDEIEYWDYEARNFVIPNKVNRLFTVPINIGIQRSINLKDLSKSFRPFIGASAINMIIWQLPYKADFFNEIRDGKFHYRFGGAAYIGADFGAFNTALISFKMKYCFVPWGSNGIESIKNFPIKNMGGFFLSLTVGSFF